VKVRLTERKHRAWALSGLGYDLHSSDDYAHWSAVVRAVLMHAGVPGEFDHDDSAQQKVGADDEGWGEFLAAVHEVMKDQAWPVRDLVEQGTFPSVSAAYEAGAKALLVQEARSRAWWEETLHRCEDAEKHPERLLDADTFFADVRKDIDRRKEILKRK
jgi:Arc/MetJ-type ribon-helix-helix transcriptional regulator